MPTVALASSEGKWIMTASILASAMAFIDSTALNVVLPALQESLQASGSEVFWVLNAYLLMLASLILIGGTLGDNIGRKKVFTTGITIFIIGSVVCGFAPDVSWLVIFRILQGIGGAFMIPGSLSIISSSINEKERGRAIGTWSAFTTIVTLGGPIVGGALADAGLWRYIFFINVPFGIAALLILRFRVKDMQEHSSGQRLDMLGAVLIAAALGAITFGFLRIPKVGLHQFQTYFTLGAGIIMLFLFVCAEYKSKHPMMPLALFRNTTFSGANLLTLLLYAGLGGGLLLLSLNLVQIQGYSQLQSGLTFLPFTLLMIGIARIAGNLADQFGPRRFLIFGPLVVSVGLLMLSFVKQTSGPDDYWTSFFPGIIVFGLGMSFTVAPLTAAVMGSVEDVHSGTASGVNNAITRIAGVFANAIFGGLAVLFFSGELSTQLHKMPVSQSEKKLILKQAENLGDAQIPKQITGHQRKLVETAYHESFIKGYGMIMKISSCLAFLAAMAALFLIRDKNHKVDGQTRSDGV